MARRAFNWSENYRNVDTDPLDLLKRVTKRLHQRRKLFATLYRLAPPDKQKPTRILEVASGMGIESNLLSLLGYSVYGADINADALEYSSRVKRFFSSSRMNMLRGNAFGLPFADQQFDVTFSQGFLEHFDDNTVVKLIQEQLRVLRPGGFLVIDVPNKWSAYSLYKLRFSLAGGWLYGFERQFSRRQLRAFVRRASPDVRFTDAYGWSFKGYPVGSAFDYAVMAPLLVLRALALLFGRGHDSVCVLFRKPGE